MFTYSGAAPSTSRRRPPRYSFYGEMGNRQNARVGRRAECNWCVLAIGQTKGSKR